MGGCWVGGGCMGGCWVGGRGRGLRKAKLSQGLADSWLSLAKNNYTLLG